MPQRFPAPPDIQDLPRVEEEVLAAWKAGDVFRQSLEQEAPRGPFVFFEGPPTANNKPHIGHALTRAVKDVVPRFRTMRGYRVARRAGWDTHGLPVEISIERKLGFTAKSDIERYGIEAFNKECEDSVRTYERDWVKASERLGFWLDYDAAYFTFTNRYVESVWWILARMFDAGMLYEGHKVLPYCPLCGTTHSSHEVAQGWKDVKDPSVTVAFPLLDGQRLDGIDLDGAMVLAWTTTPWTLPSNMALCVHPDHRYRLVESSAIPGRRYLFAEGLQGPVEELVDGKGRDLREAAPLLIVPGSALVGLVYEPLFDFTGTGTEARDRPRPASGGAWSVVADSYVTLDSGTGIVHVAPAFGEDDHRVGRLVGLPMYCALEAGGTFKSHCGPLAGLWFKDADEIVIADLKSRSQLVRSAKYEHPYPHCWRHNTPLYYFATSSWFVRTTAMRDRLLANNKKIRWNPDHVGDGRFGKWLEGVVDWALSRKRYWGTPLPIWRCGGCDRTECFGSYADLFGRAGKPLPADPYDRASFNPHRPFVDDLRFPCRACDGSMARVVEVIDCWFDAGAMPFAQAHYPFDAAAAAAIDSGEAFPADFISEAVDQTRGWFYTLHVIATFLKDSPAFRSCIVLGHVLDEQGRKMSKNLGNVIAPDTVIDRFGADAFRWFFYRSNPTMPSRFGAEMVRDSLKVLVLPLLSSWSFFTIYANVDGFDPRRSVAPALADRPALDRWVLSLLERLKADVAADLEANDLFGATGRFEAFVESLTNWYIRRSRRRFWKNEDDADKRSAHHTLFEVLRTLSLLLAPFVPFLAERLYAAMEGESRSVHLQAWPESDPTRIDEDVLVSVAAVRRVVALGHSARATTSLGVRQPLASATIVTVDPLVRAALDDGAMRTLVQDELNVQALQVAAERGLWVTYQVKPNFRVLGKRVGKRMQAVAAAVALLDPAATVSRWEREGRVEIDPADGLGPIEVTGEELDVRVLQREGTTSVHDEAVLVALDTTLGPALLREGLAREFVNRLQGLRKDLDLPFDARVRLRWDGGPDTLDAMENHGTFVADEVLAVATERVPGHEGRLREELRDTWFCASLEVVTA